MKHWFYKIEVNKLNDNLLLILKTDFISTSRIVNVDESGFTARQKVLGHYMKNPILREIHHFPMKSNVIRKTTSAETQLINMVLRSHLLL
jgi:hypothetical protein